MGTISGRLRKTPPTLQRGRSGARGETGDTALAVWRHDVLGPRREIQTIILKTSESFFSPLIPSRRDPGESRAVSMAFVSPDRSTSNDCAQGNIQALACRPESARDRLACGDSDCGLVTGHTEIDPATGRRSVSGLPTIHELKRFHEIWQP